jgi:hypothetical protein
VDAYIYDHVRTSRWRAEGTLNRPRVRRTHTPIPQKLALYLRRVNPRLGINLGPRASSRVRWTLAAVVS